MRTDYDEDDLSPPPPRRPGLDFMVAGVVLALLAVFCGGAWTYLMFIGEQFTGGHHNAAILTGLASFAVLIAGSLFVAAGVRSGQNLLNAAKTLVIAALMTL